jgi:hypothetical protein
MRKGFPIYEERFPNVWGKVSQYARICFIIYEKMLTTQIKNKIKIFLIYKEIQNGAVANSENYAQKPQRNCMFMNSASGE